MTAILRRLPHVWQQLVKSNALVETNPSHIAHENYLQKLRIGIHRVEPALRETIIKASRDVAAKQQSTSSRNVIIEVEDASVLEDVPMWMQGDPDLNTDAKLRQREKLRYHRRVLDGLNDIYLAAMASQQALEGGGELPTELSEAGHAMMMIRVYKLMIKAYDADDARKSIAEDWANDSKGAKTISRKGVFDSFFELADACEALRLNAPCGCIWFQMRPRSTADQGRPIVRRDLMHRPVCVRSLSEGAVVQVGPDSAWADRPGLEGRIGHHI
jgi:hypothetical protein